MDIAEGKGVRERNENSGFENRKNVVDVRKVSMGRIGIQATRHRHVMRDGRA